MVGPVIGERDTAHNFFARSTQPNMAKSSFPPASSAEVGVRRFADSEFSSPEASTQQTLLAPEFRTVHTPVALAEALNRVQFGIIIGRPDRRPTFTNVYAEALLTRRAGLALTDGGLEARRASDTREMRDAMTRAVEGRLERCVTMLLPRGDLLRPLVVHIPVPGPSATVTAQATLFACDPNLEPIVDQSALRRLFGFTHAEAALATLLISGRSVEQATDRLCVSIHTGRTHLKRMMLKTDTGRQAELLRLLLTCSAHIRLD